MLLNKLHSSVVDGQFAEQEATGSVLGWVKYVKWAIMAGLPDAKD